MILVEDYGIYNIKIPDEMFEEHKQVNEICDEILKAGYGDKLKFLGLCKKTRF